MSDSRRVASGTCVVALRGERFDGHSFAAEALRLGAGAVVVERNDSQASLLTGGFRSTLFREPTSGGELSFRNDDFRVTLQGDVLTLEQSTRQITCLRSEEV